MKKIFSIVALMMLCAANVFAQDNDKKAVCVDNFSYASGIGTNWVTNLRNVVIEGLIATGRVDVLDIKTLSDLPDKEEERLNQLREKGVQVLIKGHYNSLDCKAKTKDGKTKYETASDFTLTLIDLETGATTATQTIKNTWYSGSTEEESITKAIQEATDDMKKFVDNNFKMEAVIKALDQVDPKKGVKSVYISVGSDAGIQPGQMFDVFQEIEIAGEKATKQIGTAKAKEVVNARMTLCTISKGGVEIKEAFDNGVKLTVVSRAAKTVLDLF